ncbi:MAG: hypothetical protein KHZ62_00520 [Clostridiales bacterium]|nr:hypothetical protein [Clostridiales bacterium]
MTERELERLSFLKREAAEENQRLRQLKRFREGRGFFITGMPAGTDFRDMTGEIAAEIADLEKKVQKNIRRCLEEIKRLEEFIATVEESELRLMLRYRYVEGKTWQQTAFAMGYADESVPRKRFQRWMRTKVEKKNA